MCIGPLWYGQKWECNVFSGVDASFSNMYPRLHKLSVCCRMAVWLGCNMQCPARSALRLFMLVKTHVAACREARQALIAIISQCRKCGPQRNTLTKCSYTEVGRWFPSQLMLQQDHRNEGFQEYGIELVWRALLYPLPASRGWWPMMYEAKDKVVNNVWLEYGTFTAHSQHRLRNNIHIFAVLEAPIGRLLCL